LVSWGTVQPLSQMETIDSCLCGATDARFCFSKWDYQIVECPHCGLAYVNPRNFVVEADGYFEGPYLSTIEDNGTLKPGIEHIYSAIVKNLATRLFPSRLLDVGCAMGHFMAYARDYGWNPSGVECSTFAAAYGRTRFGLDIKAACDLREARFPEAEFDACVLIEVAEHLPYPNQTFTEVFRVLKPGGTVYVTTPNWGSFHSLLQREEWGAVIPTGHLYYFKPASIAHLLGSIGFTEILDLTPPGNYAAILAESRASRSLRLDDAALSTLTSQIEREDAGKLSNARGDGLTCIARKPLAGTVCGPHKLEGKLVQGSDDQKIYLVRDGQKHWVTSSEWLLKRGMRLEDTQKISHDDLNSLLIGSPLE
jgi:SAM-dependent methyltransferase